MRNLFKTVDDAEAFSARARANRGLPTPSSYPPMPAVKAPAPTETDECRTFIDWTKLVRYRGRPLFDRVVKIPNDRGKRSVFTAVMVAIGMKRGFPDYVILAPMFTGATLAGGLLIEAKRRDRGTVDADQLAWRDLLREFGYVAEICEGSAQMIEAVRQYMKLAPPGAWVDTTRGNL